MTAETPAVVVLTSALPRWPAPDAGTRYLQQLCDAVAARSSLLVLGPDFAGNADPQVPAGSAVRLAVVAPTGRTNALARSAYMTLTRLDPTVPYTPFVLGLRRRWRAEVAGAVTVDLQWPETLPLARWVRRTNPTAVVVATHHDVLSQRYARWSEAAGSTRQRLRWRWGSLRARRMQRRVDRWVDHHVVFSAKDADLLRDQGITAVTVVDPPLTLPGPAGGPLAERDRTVLFVGFLSRPENDEAARWLVEQVWPRVVAQVPDARCVVVGSGASAGLVEAAERAGSVRLAGFVEDLGAAYAEARVCAVPLHRGAGTKFKTIEALAAGLPVVSTEIGAEGVGDAGSFLALTSGPAAFADGLVRGLLEPDQARADANRAWAVDRFGTERFERAVADLYLSGRAPSRR